MGKIKRPLGKWETALHLLHEELEGTGITATILCCDGNLDVIHMRKALECCFQKHPALRAIIERSLSTNYFAYTAAFSDIEIQYLEGSHDDQWKSVVEASIGQKFDIATCLWRFHIVKSPAQCRYHCILTTHHIITDGLSISNVFDELLKYYEMIEYGQPIAIHTYDVMPPMESVLASRLDHEKFQAPVLEEPPISNRSYPLLQFAYQNFVPLGQRTTKCVYYILDNENNVRLLRACKAKQVTIGAALNAAMLCACRAMNATACSIRLLTPVSVRRFCQPEISREVLGFYVACVPTEHDVAADTLEVFWNLAKEYKYTLNAQTPKVILSESQQAELQPKPMNRMLDIDEAFCRRHFSAGCAISNKGRLALRKHYGSLEIKAVYTSVSRQSGDIAVSLSVGEWQGQQMFAFSYADPLLSEDWVHNFIKTYLSCLERAFANSEVIPC